MLLDIIIYICFGFTVGCDFLLHKSIIFLCVEVFFCIVHTKKFAAYSIQFAANSLDTRLKGSDSVKVILEENLLNQFERNDTSLQAVLNFLFNTVLILHHLHLRLHHIASTETLGLDDFHIAHDTLPVISKNLVDGIFVNKRHTLATTKDVGGNEVALHDFLHLLYIVDKTDVKHTLKVFKSSYETSLEVLYGTVLMNCFHDVGHLDCRVRPILLWSEQLLLKCRECTPILTEVSNLTIRYATKHCGINIVLHRCFT